MFIKHSYKRAFNHCENKVCADQIRGLPTSIGVSARQPMLINLVAFNTSRGISSDLSSKILKKSGSGFNNSKDFKFHKVINLNEKKHKLIFEVSSDLLSNLAQNH